MACIGDSNVASAMGGVLSIISTSLYPDIPTIMCCTIASASSKAFAMKPPITTTDLLTSSTSSFSNMLPLSNVVVLWCSKEKQFGLQFADVPSSLPQVLPWCHELQNLICLKNAVPSPSSRFDLIPHHRPQCKNCGCTHFHLGYGILIFLN